MHSRYLTWTAFSLAPGVSLEPGYARTCDYNSVYGDRTIAEKSIHAITLFLAAILVGMALRLLANRRWANNLLQLLVPECPISYCVKVAYSAFMYLYWIQPAKAGPA